VNQAEALSELLQPIMMYAMTSEPLRGTHPARSSRRKRTLLSLWPVLCLIPLWLMLISLWFVVGSRSVEAREGMRVGLLIGLVAVVPAVALLFVVTIGLYNRKARSLVALAGPGGWGAACLDADNARSWRVLLVDGAGVRMVDRSGLARRDWTWESIRNVTVEKFPVALVTRTGVVLHLGDGSRAEMLLPSRTTLAIPPARAEAAANEIRRRLAAFRAPLPTEAPSQ
jgi:hypothetical protein